MVANTVKTKTQIVDPLYMTTWLPLMNGTTKNKVTKKPLLGGKKLPANKLDTGNLPDVRG